MITSILNIIKPPARLVWRSGSAPLGGALKGASPSPRGGTAPRPRPPLPPPRSAAPANSEPRQMLPASRRPANRHFVLSKCKNTLFLPPSFSPPPARSPYRPRHSQKRPPGPHAHPQLKAALPPAPHPRTRLESGAPGLARLRHAPAVALGESLFSPISRLHPGAPATPPASPGVNE